MAIYRRRIPDPPSSMTGPLAAWMQGLATYLNGQPVVSLFSGVTPNSVLTGMPGDLALNVGSASTDSRFWLKGGAGNTVSKTGWVVLRTMA